MVQRHTLVQAGTIAAIYVAAGAAWILLSDWVLFGDPLVFHGPGLMSILKGLGFVLVTGLVLFLALARLLEQRWSESSRQRLADFKWIVCGG